MRRRGGWVVEAVATVVAISLALVLTTTTTTMARAARRARAVGVTATTVTVAGIVGTDPVSAGAEIGAQARFARANRGTGVAGRAVEYLRTEPAGDAATADTAARRVAGEAFAVVPAIGPAVGATVLQDESVPFFGDANGVDWYTNRTGFGVTGVAVNERTRIAASPLGLQLATVIGDTSDTVVVAHDADPTGTARAAQARRSLRAAGFRDVQLVPVPLSPAAPSLPSAVSPGVVVLVTGAARAAELAGQLVAAGSTATVVVGDEFYAPDAPAVATGLTVLVPLAPSEELTRANRRLAADVEAFAPGTALTAAVARGYWSADLFVHALERTGRRLTRDRLLRVLNGDDFTYEVAGTVGRSTWPEMHTQPVPCGSLLQSDGTRYLVVAPYRCAPAPPPRGR